MMPSCSHTGTPRHFHSSTTSGSASLISARIRASSLPRQSGSSLILASMCFDGDVMASTLPLQLRELHEVAARVLEHRDRRAGHRGRGHRELRAARLDALVVALDVAGE